MKLAIKKTKWVIKVFEGAKVLVKEGDKVEKGDVILTSERGEIKSMDASVILSRVSKEKIKSLNETLQGREVIEGELIYEDAGMFSKKIFSFCNGIFLGIDEFFNIYIEEKSEVIEKKMVYSPVKAKVVRVNDEEVALEFRAVEFNGEGIIEGKVWGNSCFRDIEKMNELNSSLEDKIIITSNSEFSFLTKADVVGVNAIIIDLKDKEKFSNIEIQIPILALKSDYIKALKSEFGDKDKRVLLNSKTGRLLVTISKND